MTKKEIFFLVLIFICVLSCSKSPPSIIGAYRLNDDLFIDSIILNKDSTYQHIYIVDKGKKYQNKGKWKLNSFQNQISFEDFVSFNDSGALARGVWTSRIEISDNEIRLIYSSEEDAYYSKKGEL